MPDSCTETDILLRLDETDAAGSPLVYNIDLAVVIVAEDVKIVVDVIQGKDGLLDRDGLG